MKGLTNEVTIIEGCAYISLSKGYVTMIDEVDLPIVRGIKFYAEDGTKLVGVISNA
jgi:hypothetical protein